MPPSETTTTFTPLSHWRCNLRKHVNNTHVHLFFLLQQLICASDMERKAGLSSHGATSSANGFNAATFRAPQTIQAPIGTASSSQITTPCPGAAPAAASFSLWEPTPQWQPTQAGVFYIESGRIFQVTADLKWFWCENGFEINTQPSSFVLSQSPTVPSPPHAIILDSGAHPSMTPNRSSLDSIHPTSHLINTANGTIRATQQGTLAIETTDVLNQPYTIHLPHTLLNDALPNTLVSVSQLKSLGFHVDLMQDILTTPTGQQIHLTMLNGLWSFPPPLTVVKGRFRKSPSSPPSSAPSSPPFSLPVSNPFSALQTQAPASLPQPAKKLRVQDSPTVVDNMRVPSFAHAMSDDELALHEHCKHSHPNNSSLQRLFAPAPSSFTVPSPTRPFSPFAVQHVSR